jgi:hypothetical protein
MLLNVLLSCPYQSVQFVPVGLRELKPTLDWPKVTKVPEFLVLINLTADYKTTRHDCINEPVRAFVGFFLAWQQNNVALPQKLLLGGCRPRHALNLIVCPCAVRHIVLFEHLPIRQYFFQIALMS